MAPLPADVTEITIGELADRSGVPASALRFYERQGLIRSRRTSGNQRRYDRATLRQVAFIRASHHLGIPLTVIGEVLALLPEGVAPSHDFWVKASECWSAELNSRIQRLERMRDRFTECIGCGCLSFEQCTLVNANDDLGRDGAGPRRLFNS
ncbi:redox-sensitive transcriptional activator SoxR [Actinopolymorpha pittospori]|uniref:MerR family redox-sensitive transcriptional activator SoxR n=1 Tax=Actinopolymorpha pittospori TaxID=648752 RepID=A0A927RPJ7_9ACTN|nr:redox-sensitive transcriptional activator SoxR [Actinopolymorpha pittospori]MBE1612196.1 MerR family redox-sensitive transcriptional activator SoxR [Actinopolymorpha pittospori]